MPFVRDARTALLIVDMDNDNCTGMYTVYNPQEYLENAVRLRQACYDAGVPVVQVKQTYDPLCRGHDAPLQEVRLEDGVTPAASLQGTPGWQIVDDLDPGDRRYCCPQAPLGRVFRNEITGSLTITEGRATGLYRWLYRCLPSDYGFQRLFL